MINDDVKKLTKTMDDNFKLLLAELARVKTELSDSRATQFRYYTELSKIGKDMNRIDSVLETISDDQKHQTKLLNTLWDQTVEVTASLEGIKESINQLETRIDQKDRYLDNTTDKVLNHETRIKDIEAVPIIAHQIKVKK